MIVLHDVMDELPFEIVKEIRLQAIDLDYNGEESEAFRLGGYRRERRRALWNNNEAAGAKRGSPSRRLLKGRAAGVMVNEK